MFLSDMYPIMGGTETRADIKFVACVHACIIYPTTLGNPQWRSLPPPLDPDVWLPCATPLSRLPAVGSQVYYFPYGHSEQCPAPLPAPLPVPHLFPCTVASVDLFADAHTDEPHAIISLVPGPHRGPSTDDAPVPSPPDAQAQLLADRPSFCYYAKQLTQSDANNGGGFSVPRFCADSIFPKLDFHADPPVQKLRMRDLLGKQWDFRHIYRGTPRRHLLTTGWSKFVNAKLLVAGDAVVFMRRPDGELLAGVRRTPRYPASQNAGEPPRNARARVPPQEVVDAARLAGEGTPFTVTYYPRQGAGEFVVPRKEVENALIGAWEPGVRVRARMQLMDAEERHSEWINGVVRAVHPSIWRMLEIDWDESAPPSLRNRHVNAWQVELVGYPPLLKKLRMSETIGPLCAGDVAMADPLVGPESQNIAIQLNSPITAGMQGARQDGLADIPSSSATMFTTQLLFPRDLQVPPSSRGGSSEVVNPENGSPQNNSVNMRPSEFPEEMRSIQLFGTTITSPVQSATKGSSEEVNQAPTTMVDGTANEDASATSPLDCRLSKDDGHNQNDPRHEAGSLK